MQTINVLALDKAVDAKLKKSARDVAETGEYDIDFIAHIVGKLKIGEDYDQRIVAKADPWALLAVALSKLNNITLEAIIRQVEESGLTGENVKVAAEAAMARIKADTVQTCKGKITAKLDVELVEELETVKA